MLPSTDFPTRLILFRAVLKGIHSTPTCTICLPHWSNINHKEHQHHHETHSSPLGNLCIQCDILQGKKESCRLLFTNNRLLLKQLVSKSKLTALSGILWLLTSFNRPSSCLLRLPFSHLSTSFSDKAIFRRVSSESRYSFFFFRDSDADSRFFIIRCCLWETFDWKDGNKEEKIRSRLATGSWLTTHSHHTWIHSTPAEGGKRGDYCKKAIKRMPAWTNCRVVGEICKESLSSLKHLE